MSGRTFDIGIKSGILDRKHIDAMGMSIWLYLWCIRHQTKSTGWVHGGGLITYQIIQEELDVPVRTLKRWLTLLHPVYIERTFAVHKHMRIRVMKSKKFASKQASIQFPEYNSKGPKVAHDWGHKWPLSGPKVAHLNKRVEREIEKERGIKEEQPSVALADWIPLDAWIEYRKMRELIKRPLTDRGVDLAIRTLAKLRDDGEDVREVLEQSIFYSWKGLFPVKGRNGNGNGKLTGDELTNANLRAAGFGGLN